MTGVPREEAEHSLDLDKTAKLVKQRLRRFAQDRKEAIRVEVTRLLAAGFIREVTHPDWLANPVLVRKKNGGWRMCVDYTDINKHCLKTPFLCHTSTRSLTRRLGAFYSLFLTVTQGTTR